MREVAPNVASVARREDLPVWSYSGGGHPVQSAPAGLRGPPGADPGRVFGLYCGSTAWPASQCNPQTIPCCYSITRAVLIRAIGLHSFGPLVQTVDGYRLVT